MVGCRVGSDELGAWVGGRVTGRSETTKDHVAIVMALPATSVAVNCAAKLPDSREVISIRPVAGSVRATP